MCPGRSMVELDFSYFKNSAKFKTIEKDRGDRGLASIHP